MTSEQRRRGTLEAIDRILNRSADEVLREVLVALHRHYTYVGIEFVERGETVLGPRLGTFSNEEYDPRHPDDPTKPHRVPITYQGNHVGNLLVEFSEGDDRSFLERVATLISAHVLIGWDTRGEAWEP
jgi:hypothetical protein